MTQLLPTQVPGAHFQRPAGNFIILDFEATCGQEGHSVVVRRGEMEIIEIGAIAVGEDLQSIAEFAHFVRPVRNPVLSDFCTELTSISQAEVDGAEGFKDVAQDLAIFAAEHGVSWWGSWGKYDRNQLSQDVQFHRVVDPLPQPHGNLKDIFTARQSLRKRLGLGGAVEKVGMSFAGTAHRAIDDTRNILRVLPWILGEAELNDRTVKRSAVEEGKVPG